MAPSNLSLFPSPSATLPRKPSLRRIKTDNIPNAAGDVNMKAVAFQVVSSPTLTKVEPAAELIKHSLFCTPSPVASSLPSPESAYTSSPASSTQVRRHLRTRRRSTPVIATPTTSTPATSYADSPSTIEDELAPLPNNSYFGSGTPPKRSRSTRLQRPAVSTNISSAPQQRPNNISITPVDEKIDSLSPLPVKPAFKPSSASPQAVYPGSLSSASPATLDATKSPGYSSSMQSIFPQYDHSKPMSRQNYYPTERITPPPLYMNGTVSKVATSSMERHVLKRNDSGVGIIDHYEHIPFASHTDLNDVWKASCEEFPVAGRKVRFGLFQPSSHGKSLTIGTSAEDLIYTMERDISSTTSSQKQFVVKKHCPSAPSSSPVTHLTLPDRTALEKNAKNAKERTSIFPQAAAVDAIASVMNGPAAHYIAMYDPTAESPEAAYLARSAVLAAESEHGCHLIKRHRKRDTLGSVTASYDLHHPKLGNFVVTVTKSIPTNTAMSGPRAKISLHHPSATPAAVAADTLSMAFLDFAHDACVLDVPSLLALGSHYVIDTAVCALLAVALIENDALVAESMVFDPPPRKAIKPTKADKKVQRMASVSPNTSKVMFKRSTSKQQKNEVVEIIEQEEVDLPGVAKGALKIMELGCKVTAFVVIAGVRVGLKVGTGVYDRVVAK